MAIHEKMIDRAIAILDKLLAAAPKSERGFQQYTMPQIRAMVLASKNEKLIAKLGPGGVQTTTPWLGSFLGVDSPQISVFNSVKIAPTPKVTNIPLAYQPADPKSKAGFLPLLRTDQRLYVLIMDLDPHALGQRSLQNLMHGHTVVLGEEHLAFVSLDAQGRPRGALNILELPKLDKKLDVSSAVQLGNKVCFGTYSCGILELSEDTGQWRTLGLSEGLPVKHVCSLVHLDEKTILGNGGGTEAWRNGTLFAFDSDRHFTLLHSPTYPRDQVTGIGPLTAAWRHVGKILAVEPTGLWNDLGTPKEKFNHFYSAARLRVASPSSHPGPGAGYGNTMD